MYKGQLTILRAYGKEDYEKAHKLFNDYEMMHFLSGMAVYPCSYEEETELIQNMNKNKSNAYNFAITTLDGIYIGGCGYMKLSQKDGTCMVGISIADKNYWGKGYGTDAMRVLLRFLFGELNLRKVQLGVFSYNTRGIKSYEKIGFKAEGIFKEQIYRDHAYHDELRMAIFKNEFLEKEGV